MRRGRWSTSRAPPSSPRHGSVGHDDGSGRRHSQYWLVADGCQSHGAHYRPTVEYDFSYLSKTALDNLAGELLPADDAGRRYGDSPEYPIEHESFGRRFIMGVRVNF